MPCCALGGRGPRRPRPCTELGLRRTSQRGAHAQELGLHLTSQHGARGCPGAWMRLEAALAVQSSLTQRARTNGRRAANAGAPVPPPACADPGACPSCVVRFTHAALFRRTAAASPEPRCCSLAATRERLSKGPRLQKRVQLAPPAKAGATCPDTMLPVVLLFSIHLAARWAPLPLTVGPTGEAAAATPPMRPHKRFLCRTAPTRSAAPMHQPYPNRLPQRHRPSAQSTPFSGAPLGGLTHLVHQ
mmetsp:Transcript_18132/g.54218  ORF Transcript_18132/g.54218 Transcript_18132/m.54218 type:complete len:245 (-) Transcript_18132:403-1137(-)